MTNDTSCNARSPQWLSNFAKITNKHQLPISQIHYGPLVLELEKARVIVGPLLCNPKSNEEQTYSCPLNQPGYHEFGRKCYFFDKVRRNFNDSIAHCATKFGSVGGKLFEPKDLATHNAVREKQVEEVRNSGGTSNYYQTYLGISDQGHEGTFTFVSDDSHLPFTFWESGQPNDPGSSNYDCVEIYDLPEDKNHRNDRWADIECSDTLFSICEQI